MNHSSRPLLTLGVFTLCAAQAVQAFAAPGYAPNYPYPAPQPMPPAYGAPVYGGPVPVQVYNAPPAAYGAPPVPPQVVQQAPMLQPMQAPVVQQPMPPAYAGAPVPNYPQPMPQQMMPQGMPQQQPMPIYQNPSPQAYVTPAQGPLGAQPIPTYGVGAARLATGPSTNFLNNAAAPWIIGGVVVAGGIGAAIAMTGGEDEEDSGSSRESLRDDEFNRQYGLDRVKADYAFDRGQTGADVIIAELDSGVDVSHMEFQGRIADGAYDAVLDQAGMPSADQLDNHGTLVAGVMVANRNGVGMEGVAYSAKVLPIRVLDGSGVGTNTDVIEGVNYATSSAAQIMNASLGPSDARVAAEETLGFRVFTASDISMADAYLNYTNAGKILVAATGNSYVDSPNISASPTGAGFLPFVKPANANITDVLQGAYRDDNGDPMTTADYSAMQPLTIAVAAVDENNVITAWSVRCGVAKDWCMVAPGNNIYSTDLNGGYSTVSGTSFAAPHVSAAAAILKKMYPSLTNEEIVEILLTTATDLGDAGVDDIYGHGLLNLDRATQPIGTLMLPLSNSVNGLSVELSGSSMHYGRAFGANATAKLGNQQIAFLDDYARSFTTSLGNMTHNSVSLFDSREALAGFDKSEQRQNIKLSDSMQASFQFGGSEATSINRLTSSKPRDENDTTPDIGYVSLSESFTPNTDASVHYKDNMSMAFGFSEADRASSDRSLNKDTLANPYAVFATDGYSASITTSALGGKLRFAGYFGDDERDSNATNFGSQIELGYDVGRKSSFFAGAGSLFEEQSMLGSTGEGAFAFGENTSTYYVGIGGKLALDGATMLRANAYAGWTSPGMERNSLITDASDVITTAFNADVERTSVMQKSDSLSFSMAQPLRVESGSMNFLLPTSRSATSDTVFQSYFSQDLSADGRELDFGITYSIPVAADARLSLGALYRRDAGHVSGSDDALGVLRWSQKF